MSASLRQELALRVWTHGGEPMLVVDPKTLRIVAANDPACRSLGYGHEEITCQDVTSIECSIEDSFYWDEAKAGNYSDTGAVHRYYRRRDGAIVQVEKRVSRIADGDAPLLLITFRDAQDGRSLVDEQARSTALLKATLEATADGILVTRLDGAISNMNHRFARMWSIPEALLAQRDDEAVYAHMRGCVVDEADYAATLARAVRRCDGTVFDTIELKGSRWLERFVTPLHVNGRLSGHVFSFRDITHRRQAEARLAQLNAELEERVAQRTADLARANKELEAFSYSVSHDLRSPLRAIAGFSSIVLEENESRLDADSVQHLHRIQGGAVRMGQLIDDLLALARVSRQEMQGLDFSLTELAAEVAGALTQSHPGRALQLSVAPDMRASGDPALLRVVLENLLANAWKFTSHTENARIEVGWADVEGKAAFFVRDNGAGFDIRYADKLFKAFQRLHSQQDFEGTGIGLSIVQRIVARHGGRVWAEGKVDAGATFYFTLG